MTEPPFPEPTSLDATIPDDLDACSPCDGMGAAIRWIEGEGVDVECPDCRGTGVRA